MPAPIINFSLARSLNNNKDVVAPAALPLSEFMGLFRPESYIITREKRWAQVWMPATFSHPSREAKYVTHMSVFVVDYDSGSCEELERHVRRLITSDHHFLVHSSYGFQPPKAGKARFIFFLNKPIPVATEWQWSDGCWPALTKYLGFETTADAACRDAGRAFFMPIRKNHSAPIYFYYHEGKPLDTEAIVGDVLARPVAAYDFNRPYLSEEDPEQPINLALVSFRLRLKFPNTKKPHGGAVRRVLEAEPTEPGERHETLRLFTHALARIAEPSEASENLVKIMYPWLNALGDRGDESEALRALQGAREKIPTWDAHAAHTLATQLGWFDADR